MFLKLISALIFTNIIGIIYDSILGSTTFTRRKFYLNSTGQILGMVFLRNIHLSLRILTFNKKMMMDGISIIFFIASIYFLIDYTNENLKTELIVLGISSFAIWTIAYAYIASTSEFFYLNNPGNISDREFKILNQEATTYDKTIIFIQSIFASVFSINIYVLALITAVYSYFLGILL